MSASQQAAIDRLVAESGMDERAARSEINRRIRSVRAIVGLDNYYEWAKSRGRLPGGPKLDLVNYQRIQQIIDGKPYAQNSTFTLGVWDLVDLANVRLYNEYRRSVDIQLYLDELLMLSRGELKYVRGSRNRMNKKRNI